MTSTSQQVMAVENLLTGQLEVVAVLRQILLDEFEILSQNSPEGLEDLLAKKQEALSKLATSDDALRAMLGEHGLADDAPGLEQLFSRLDSSGRLQRHWDRLAALLRECETQNQTNGGLVELSQQQVELALNVLRGETQSAPTYGADGHARRASRSRSIAEA